MPSKETTEKRGPARDPSTAQEIVSVLNSLGSPAIAEHSQRFFKTGEGEYGHGDRFLGIRVPVLRKHVRKYRDISLEEIFHLLRSPFHEARLFALLMCAERFKRGSEGERTSIYQLYITSTTFINNWDLVDSSAPHIVGAYLEKREKQVLYDMAGSDDLWERRISIISTLHLIRKNRFEDALKISRMLKNDSEDLIHKAVGWMLREIGKRAPQVERDFLRENYRDMPRTMLRYAVERFPEDERQMYLKGRI